MACTQIQALPSGSVTLTGDERFPGNDASNITRKYTPAAIALSAVQYDSDVTYPEGAIVFAADENIYRAIAAVAPDNFPELTPSLWKLQVVSNSITLNVPDDYATIIVALEAINEAVVSDTIEIQVADGAYNYTTTQLDLTHPYGRFISILGNVGTPASCSLSFAALPNPPSTPYINADSGSVFASGPSDITIDGFTILKSGGAPAFGHCGILASEGATINVGANMIVSGFYADVAALNGGNLLSDTGLSLVTVASAYAIYADNGHVQVPGVAITGPGHGVFAENRATVRLNDASVDAAIVTAYTLDNSHLEAQTVTVGNTDTFFTVTGSSSAVDTGSTYGTASVAELVVDGIFNLNDRTVTANAVNLSFTDLTAGVFTARSGTNVGTTAVFTGLQGGSGVLDAAGVLTVVATWVTANTVIIPVFNAAAATGPRLTSAISAGVNFTLTSDAGAADVGQPVKWIAIVYP